MMVMVSQCLHRIFDCVGNRHGLHLPLALEILSAYGSANRGLYLVGVCRYQSVNTQP